MLITIPAPQYGQEFGRVSVGCSMTRIFGYVGLDVKGIIPKYSLASETDLCLKSHPMKKIQVVREKKNLSRAMLAAKSGVSERVIHLIETGTKPRKVQMRTFVALSAALGVKVSHLFVGGQAVEVR